MKNRSLFVCLILGACIFRSTVAQDRPESLAALDHVCQQIEHEKLGLASLLNADVEDEIDPELLSLVGTMRDAYEAAQHMTPRDPAYVKDLIVLYDAFLEIQSYDALVMATLTKFLLVDAIWVELQTQPTEVRLRELDRICEEIRLPAENLKPLIHPDWHPSDEYLSTLPSDPHVQILMQIQESNEASDIFDEVGGWAADRGGAEKATIESLLIDRRRVVLCYMALLSERLNVVNARGAISYLLKDGEPNAVTTWNMESLRRVISDEEASGFSFVAIGAKRLYPSDLRSVFDFRKDVERRFNTQWETRIFTLND